MQRYNLLNEYKVIADNAIKNTLTWHDAYNAVYVVDDTSTTRGLFYLHLGKLSAGETVKVSFEYLSDGDGIQARFNRYATNLYATETNVVTVIKLPNNQFEHVELTFTADTDGFYRIEVGSPLPHVSKFYLRDLTINNSYVKSNLTQRLYEFTVVNGVITLGSFGDSFTVAKGTIDGRYTLTYDVPFGRTNSVSGIFPGKSAGNPNPRLEPLTRSVNRAGCTMQFHDNATGAFLTWAQVEALTGTYYFSLLVTGYDI